jgi:CHAT domain-containing protein/tetratricopeptide (TPR) repeat protein
MSQDHWDRAIGEYLDILKTGTGKLTSLESAGIYNDLGFLYQRQLDNERAEYYLGLAAKFHEQSGIQLPLEYAKVCQNLGLLYMDIAAFDESLTFLERAVSLIQANSKDAILLAKAKSMLARLYEEGGNTEYAFELFQEQYQVFLSHSGSESPDYAEVCSHMGRIYLLTGQPSKAEEYFNKSSAIYKKLGTNYRLEHAITLENLGAFYQKMGRYPEAEKTMLASLEMKKSVEDGSQALIIASLNDLGILYEELNNIPRAKELFQQVVDESKKHVGTEHPIYATALNNLGNIAKRQRQFAEAKASFLEAIAIYDRKYGPEHPISADALNNLATVERWLGNVSQAEQYYKRVLKIDEKVFGKLHPEYATTLLNLGILYSSIGSEMEAEAYYLEAAQIRKQVLGENHKYYASALESLGIHYFALGQLDLSEEYFRKAAEILIGQIATNFPVMTEEERELFYQEISEDIARYNFVATSLLYKRPELVKTIFDFQIKTKAILFNSSTKVNQKLEASDPKLREQYREWQKEKRMLTNFYMMGTQELERNNINIADYERVVANLEKQLVLGLSEFGALLPADNENWQSVQRKVKPDEAIVEIIRIKELKIIKEADQTIYGFTDNTRYLAIIFSSNNPSGPTYAILGNDYHPEDSWYARYRNSFLYDIEDKESFKVLWKPIHDKIGEVKRVRVSPDGIFYKMNPNSFQLPSGDFLIDRYFVSYITSCKDLFREPTKEVRRRAYLFGNPLFVSAGNGQSVGLQPLPGAESEIKSIGDLLTVDGWSQKSFIKGDATETSLRSAINPTILHVATHGYFGDQGAVIKQLETNTNPLFKSGLYLANVSDTYKAYQTGGSTISFNDGILTAYEAMGLSLENTNLVVLSACESGLGDVKNGEGVFGLQRAFMVAGARNLITSIVKVQDQATNELMVAFYKNYSTTNNIGESMRKAQISIKNKYKKANIWGAFMLIGTD